jgi:uncharacterized protein
MSTSSSGAGIRSRLQTALRAAMKERDAVAVSGLRSALAAIANAEAVPLPTAPSGRPPAGDQHVAGSVPGPGGGEASRRAITEDEATAIAVAEVTERRTAARDYEAAGHPDRARRLLREARAIESALDRAARGDDA